MVANGSLFNTRQPAAMGDPYSGTDRNPKCRVNLLPDESFHNFEHMLFDAADVREISNFIMQVCFLLAFSCQPFLEVYLFGISNLLRVFC